MPILKLLFKAGKNAWASDLKRCDHVVSLLYVFDNHIQTVSCRISADVLDIGIVLLPNIGIGIGPKNPILVGP